jgi:hypothetical protein
VARRESSATMSTDSFAASVPTVRTVSVIGRAVTT